MKRKQKKSKRRNASNGNWRWEDDFEGAERPKVKINKGNKRQQTREAIRAGHFEDELSKGGLVRVQELAT